MNSHLSAAKIGLIGPAYPFRGGIAHYSTLLCKALRKRHEVKFISFIRQYPSFLFPGKTDKDPSGRPFMAGDVEYVIDSLNPVTWLKAAAQLVGFSPDTVIISWWVSFWAPQFLIILLLLKIFGKSKILFICHNVAEHESKPIDKLLTRVVLGLGDFFIVHSTEDEQNLLDMFPQATIRKHFHPTYDVFDLGHCDSQIVRKKYGIVGPVILFFGFIREYKGLKYLIKALPEVLSEVKVTLLVVGEFWKDKDEYLALIEKLKIEKNIILVDEYIPNEEVGDYFLAADLVVQPYVSATGSGIIQVAYGFKKPVIATTVGSLPEVIDNGKTGYLVPPESSQELAEAIIRFFRSGNSQEFRRNIPRQSYKFSWNRIVDVIEELVFRA